jgi:hypothetical protein
LDLFGKRIGVFGKKIDVFGKKIGRWETKWTVYENDALVNSGALLSPFAVRHVEQSAAASRNILLLVSITITCGQQDLSTPFSFANATQNSAQDGGFVCNYGERLQRSEDSSPQKNNPKNLMILQ